MLAQAALLHRQSEFGPLVRYLGGCGGDVGEVCEGRGSLAILGDWVSF